MNAQRLPYYILVNQVQRKIKLGSIFISNLYFHLHLKIPMFKTFEHENFCVFNSMQSNTENISISIAYYTMSMMSL